MSHGAERTEYYERLKPHGLSPLWERLHALVPKEPNHAATPHVWRYDRTVRSLLMEAGALITAREAERRVLILDNPGLPGRAAIAPSLYAGVQLVLPGDVAPAHRHTQNALRFILEGRGAYTAVEGERTLMHPGDLVITPAWQWHDHGNDTDAPMVWLDGLDIPIVEFFSAGFAEAANAEVQTIARPVGDSDLRYGANLAPVDWKPTTKSSPVFNYPYARTRDALLAMQRAQAPDSHHGYKLRYVNPATGGHVTPTLAAFMQLLPAGLESGRYQSTDSTVFCVVEGEGVTTIGEERIAWSARDIFVAPSWMPIQHRAASEAIIFSFSDRAAQEHLGLWRERRA